MTIGTRIETVRTFTPLGIDFWDLLTDGPITDGLVATAYPSGRAGAVRSGVSLSGVHAFWGLPGLRGVEYLAPDADLESLLLSGPSQDFDVLVVDRRGRFLPTVVQLTAPILGLATAADALAGCSPPGGSFPEDMPLFLLSAPARNLPAGTAAIRAQLVDRGTGEPAAHAVLRATVDGTPWLGVADERGAVVVALPYPPFAAGPAGSFADSVPAGAHGVPTDDQTWAVTIEVRAQPSALESSTALDFPPEVATPRLHSVLCQGAAGVWDATGDGAAAAQLIRDLRYGRDLVVTTEGSDRSELLIERAA